MHIRSVFITGFCAIAASVVSVHFFVDPLLEYRMLRSADAHLEVRGGVYESQDISLANIDREAVFPFSHFYTLLPTEAYFSQEIFARYLLSSDREALYFFDTRGYWKPLFATERDGYADARISSGGMYALGARVHVETPLFVDVLEEIRSSLPPQTTSYSVALLAQIEGADPIFLSEIERGGCGGTPSYARDMYSFSRERTVQVLVNDVLREVTFLFLVDGGTTPQGCVEDMPMEVIF